MKKWLWAFAIGLLLATPVAAFWQSRDSNYNVKIPASGTNNLAVDPNAGFKATANATTGTTIAATISTTNSPDCIYVSIADAPLGTATIADTALLTWTARTGSPYSGGGHVLNVWTAPSPSALTSDVITITDLSGYSYATMSVFAISGCNTSAMFDGNLSGGPVVATPDPAAITTTNPFDMIIGVCDSGTAANSAGSGFTLLNAANFAANEYKIVSTTQSSLSVGWTTGATTCHTMIADAVVSR